MQSTNSEIVDFLGRKGRQARRGGFAYTLTVASTEPVELIVTSGGEWEPRTFEFFVEGDRLTTQSLGTNRPGNFFEVRYPVPAALTARKETVTLRIEARHGQLAGTLFGGRLAQRER